MKFIRKAVCTLLLLSNAIIGVPKMAMSVSAESIPNNTQTSLYMNKFSAVPNNCVVTAGKVSVGQNILINNDHAYIFNQSTDIIECFDLPNRKFIVSFDDIDGDRFTLNEFNLMTQDYKSIYPNEFLGVCSGFRTYELQKRNFDASVERQGLTETLKWFTRPGYSEHHSGYAIDFYTDSYGSKAFTGKGNQSWFRNNCQKYGFILRYTAEKQPITGVNPEPWHFRQVGIPHADYIMKHNVCYEEYIDLIKSYTSKKPLVVNPDAGGTYYIFYQKGSDGAKVDLTGYSKYYCSGNNVDGFIITAIRDDFYLPTVSGDFNGDGVDDVAQFTMNEPFVTQIDLYTSDKSKFTKRSNVWNSGKGFNVDMFTHRLVAGDFNGDKKDDICVFYDYGKGECRAFVWESTGTGFKLNWNFWYMQNGFYPSHINDKIAVGDFNADGKDDICAFYDYGKGECRAFVWQSRGSNFKLDWNYWYMKSGFYADRVASRVTAGDFNGDKKSDICAFYDYGKGECRAFVWQSRGNDFKLDWNYWYMKSGFYADKLDFRVTSGDYNNDKKSDICAFYDYGKGELRAFVWRSIGNAFKLDWNWWYMPSGFYSDNLTGRVVSGDFNGDKKTDVGAYYYYTDGSEKGRIFVFRSAGNSFKLDWNWYCA